MGEQETVEIVKITPALARVWLTKLYDHQRPLYRHVWQAYARDMRRGQWRDCESAIMWGIRGDRDHLMNGQHRLTAIVESDTSQKFIVKRKVYESDSEMDLAYAAMDRGARRSVSAQVHALSLGDIVGVPDTVARSAIASLRIVLDDFKQYQVVSREYFSTPADLKKAVELWSTQIYAYHHALLGAPRSVQEWYWRAEVAAVALVTYKFCPEIASTFWNASAMNENLTPGSPEYLLFYMLASRPAATGAARGSLSRRVACAWNARVRNENLKHLQARGATANIQLLATPWERRDRNVDTVQVVFGGK